MNNIIFLDIDGVLTNDTQITKTMPKRHRIINKPILDLTDEVELALLDFDYKCINNLKEIANNTNSSIVITSSLKSTIVYPYIAEYLVRLGLPIIDRTETLNDKYQEISVTNDGNIRVFAPTKDKLNHAIKVANHYELDYEAGASTGYTDPGKAFYCTIKIPEEKQDEYVTYDARPDVMSKWLERKNKGDKSAA